MDEKEGARLPLRYPDSGEKRKNRGILDVEDEEGDMYKGDEETAEAI